MATEVLPPIASGVYLRPNTPLRPSTPTSRATSRASSPVSLKRSERPLPAPPVPPKALPDLNHFSSKSPLSSPKTLLRSLEAGPSRSRPVSWATVSSRRALSRMLKQPRVLAHLLYQLSWRDFHALASSSREFRHGWMRHPECRDAILAQYVPGYGYAASTADLSMFREVTVDFHDLTLLVMSQFVPLHKYPMHSLSILNDLTESANQFRLYESTHKYVALTQAHSRFVLLLQALVHSAPISPLSDDSEDGFNVLATPGARAPQFSGIRELVFPAPLSYFGAEHQRDSSRLETGQPSGARGHRRTHTAGSANSAYGSRALSLSPTRASGDFHALLNRADRRAKSRRMSIFGGTRIPPPPPASEPIALKYANNWRRSSVIKSPPRIRHSTSVASVSEDDLKAPKRRFTATNSSSESSLLSPPSSRSNTDRTDSSPSPSRRGLPADPHVLPPPPAGVAVPRGTSPHDLYLATSRTRAPVLRTFVPCTELDDTAIAACEEQLVDAGLWDHLSVGDVVCNFGYVPPADGDSAADGKQVWLVYEGSSLVPYVPPAPPPVEDPLSLPSPFYYSHILPPFSNPVYILSLPALAQGVSTNGYDREHNPHLQLTLMHAPTRVRSPHSPSGFAVVRKYVWIARLPYVGPGSGAGAGLGKGWQGEWLLEGEGTREGRQSLLDALSDGPDGSGLTRRGKWEVVRDKSGSGRLWMKLLVPNVDHIHEITDACEDIVDLPPTRTSTRN